MTYLVAILGLLLALSAAGNAWQFHHGEKIVAAKAAMEQLAADTKEAAQACTRGVDDLAKASRTRGLALAELMRQVAPKVAQMQEASLVALQARPDNPQDLCGSLQRYLQGQIKADRARGFP